MPPLRLNRFSPDGRLLVGISGLAVHLLDAETRKRRLTLQGHETDITLVEFSRNGQRLVTASSDGSVRVWDREVKLLHVLGRAPGGSPRRRLQPGRP